MIKSCGECSNLCNHGCKRPDRCVANGYCDFRSGRVKPWETCQHCGGKMVNIGRGRWESDTMYVSTVQCKACGIEARYTQDYGRERFVG